MSQYVYNIVKIKNSQNIKNGNFTLYRMFILTFDERLKVIVCNSFLNYNKFNKIRNLIFSKNWFCKNFLVFP